MILAVVRQMAREGRRPARDVVVAMFADEEAGGAFGARWLVDNRPDLFEGATEAISEVGGYSVEIDGRRAYLLQTAEKGIGWLRLVADGRAGHGSQVNTDNAVTHLAAAVARIGQHPWPLTLTPTVRRLLEGVADLTGTRFDARTTRTGSTGSSPRSARRPGSWAPPSATRPTRRSSRPGTRRTSSPAAPRRCWTPASCPGHGEEAMATLRRLAGEHVRIEPIHQDIALEVPFEGDLVDAMVAALLAEDPGAAVLPYTLSGGTDNKSLARLGITGYGFAPLLLPPELDFSAMFHGVDERVPTSALTFGVRVLDRLLATG